MLCVLVFLQYVNSIIVYLFVTQTARFASTVLKYYLFENVLRYQIKLEHYFMHTSLPVNVG